MACKRVPSYVIKPDDMANVLADMHTAEAVVDMSYRDFSTDSARLALREAVYNRHGITGEQFDTSLIWYGHNIAKYIDVYDKTIEILEKRNAEAGNLATLEALNMAGDSVDIWAAAHHLALTKLMPSPLTTFDIQQDENWEKGDVYTWRVKLLPNEPAAIRWGIAANYADSTVEMLETTTTDTGWNEIIYVTDSTRILTRLRGYMEPTAENMNRTIWIDSISLVRKRIYPNIYHRRSRMRSYPEL